MDGARLYFADLSSTLARVEGHRVRIAVDEQPTESLVSSELSRRPEQGATDSAADRRGIDVEVDELSLGRIARHGEEAESYYQATSGAVLQNVEPPTPQG